MRRAILLTGVALCACGVVGLARAATTDARPTTGGADHITSTTAVLHGIGIVNTDVRFHLNKNIVTAWFPVHNDPEVSQLVTGLEQQRTYTYWIEDSNGKVGLVQSFTTTAETDDLNVTQSVSPATAAPGATVTFSAQIVNDGPDSAGGVTVSDTLGAGLALQSVTVNRGSCSTAGGITCDIGQLPVFVGSGAAVHLTVVAKATAAGALTNTVAAQGGVAVEANPANNTATATVTVSSPTPPPPPPAPRVSRAVHLQLGAGRAVGAVSARVAACKANVPVTLQRRGASRWATVARGTTDAAGRFSLALRSRTGSYRATAPQTTRGGSICLAAASAVARTAR